MREPAGELLSSGVKDPRHGRPGPALGRNRRSVWTIATQPYPGVHFAVMPEALVEPCVLAGCPEQTCAECGAPTTTGWRPTCDHAATVPGVVLDPFAGSGTVARVANRLSRRAVLIDLNPDYIAQQMRRNQSAPLGL